MGFLESVSAFFKREGRELSDTLDTAERKANESLDRRERDLAATPEEKLARIQSEIGDADDPLDAVRDKIERKARHAEAVEELRPPTATDDSENADAAEDEHEDEGEHEHEDEA